MFTQEDLELIKTALEAHVEEFESYSDEMKDLLTKLQTYKNTIVYCNNKTCAHLDKNQCSVKDRLVLSRDSSEFKQLPPYFIECINFEEKEES